MSDAPIHNVILHTETDRDVLLSQLRRAQLVDERGRALQVSVWRWQPGKSVSQRNLARAYNGLLATHAGMTPGEMWAALCTELLGEVEVVNPFTGQVRTTYISSESIEGTAKYAEFIDGIQRLAREFYRVTLPDPKSPDVWAALRCRRYQINQQ